MRRFTSISPKAFIKRGSPIGSSPGFITSRSTSTTPRASSGSRRRSAIRATASRFSCRPRRRCSSRPSTGWPAPGSPVRRCGWRSKSRSAATLNRAARSTTRSPRPSPRTERSGSTIISARKPSRTCSRSGSRTSCSSRCGTAPTSTMSRSRSRRPSGSRAAAIITTSREPSATWSRTICCNCSLWWPWNRRAISMRPRFATRRSRCSAR